MNTDWDDPTHPGRIREMALRCALEYVRIHADVNVIHTDVDVVAVATQFEKFLWPEADEGDA